MDGGPLVDFWTSIRTSRPVLDLSVTSGPLSPDLWTSLDLSPEFWTSPGPLTGLMDPSWTQPNVLPIDDVIGPTFVGDFRRHSPMVA